jgi:hypothetical protein
LVHRVRIDVKSLARQGRAFAWPRPEICLGCGGPRLWGHGFVEAWFDDCDTPLPLRRFASKNECLRSAPCDLEDHFRKRARRRVAKDRTVALDGRLYEAPVALVGAKVMLLYHPHDQRRQTLIRQTRGDHRMNAPLYRSLFGFKKEPLATDLKHEDILHTPALAAVAERFGYVVRLGAVGLVTGKVGSGKSTALRWAAGARHPSEYRILWITASGGSILETYRQLSAALEVESRSFSRAVLTRTIRAQVLGSWRKRSTPC